MTMQHGLWVEWYGSTITEARIVDGVGWVVKISDELMATGPIEVVWGPVNRSNGMIVDEPPVGAKVKVRIEVMR